MEIPARPAAPSRPPARPARPAPAGGTITARDIYYTVFRHKTKIAICSLLGLLAGAGALYLNPPTYVSEAKLFIRYVVTEGQTLTPTEDGVRKSPDQRGETIMDSEVEILTSLDLATDVAEAIGPEKILAKEGGGNSTTKAALVIMRGLIVQVPPSSSVIRVTLWHPDPTVVQPVLRELIDRYLKKHVDIHRSAGMVGEFLSQETDQFRMRLAQTEDELRKARNKAGVISPDEAKKSASNQIQYLRQEVFTAEAEIAEKSATLKELLAETHQTPAPTPTANTAPAAAHPTPAPGDVDAYIATVKHLAALQAAEQQLLTQFTEENASVKDVRTQVAAVERQKVDLEKKHPELLQLAARNGPTGAAQPPSATANAGGINFAAENARIAGLESKVKALNEQIAQVRSDVAKVDQMEVQIDELERRRNLDEANYKFYASALEQSRISEALGSGKVSNISQIQVPSPAVREKSKGQKLALSILGGGLGVGLAWAFLIELFLDRTVRRPEDVEKTLGIPLFLSIPEQQISRANPPSRWWRRKRPITALAAAAALDPEQLRAFHETLRDRLIGYFENRGLLHKPKLVAVTGLGKGTGVTTTAVGLARSLSETGEGNVLLVDLTPGGGSAQQYYRGAPALGLDDVLMERNSTQMEDKLYVVGENGNGEQLSRALPQRFNKIIPKLKASDFDYIIFDMPPVSQISITPRLAGFMDMVLLVIQSEKTDLDLVQRATALLAESKAHIGAVLNKTRSYIPALLYEDHLGHV